MIARSQTRTDGASGRNDESPISGRGRDSAAERVRSPRREDRRLAPRTATKNDVVGGKGGQLVWRVCRDLVMAATRGYHGGASANRQAVAKLLETTPGTLERMMSPGDGLSFRADHLQALMTAETIVPEAARTEAAGVLAREWGGVFVPQAEILERGRAAAAAALGLAAAAGETAGLVRSAQADGVIDAGERERIAGAAMAAQREAGAVMRAVEEGTGH